MITVPAGVRVYLAMGPTDMRKGIDSLSVLVQELLKLDPFSGHLFAFRGRRGGLLKILYWDSQGFCLAPLDARGNRSALSPFCSLHEARFGASRGGRQGDRAANCVCPH